MNIKNKIHNMLLEASKQKYMYHATYKYNVDLILKDGMIPAVGEHSEDNEDIGDAIWFFNKKNYATNYALSDVFNGRSVAVLKIDVTGIEIEQEGESIFYTKEKIPPDKIRVIEIFDGWNDDNDEEYDEEYDEELIKEEIEKLLENSDNDDSSYIQVFVLLKHDKRLKAEGIWICPIGIRGEDGVFEIEDEDSKLICYLTKDAAEKQMSVSSRIMDDSDGIFNHKVSKNRIDFRIFKGIASGILKIKDERVVCSKIVIPELNTNN